MSYTPPRRRPRRMTWPLSMGVLALLILTPLAAAPVGTSSIGFEEAAAEAGPGSGADPQPAAEAATAPMPRAGNTGPTSAPTRRMTSAQFLRSRTCRNARITDQVYVQAWSNIGAWDRTFTIDNCVLEGGFYWLVDDGGSYPVDQYPTITMRNTDILGSMVMLSPVRLTMNHSYVSQGAFWAPCADCAGSRFGLVRRMPVVVRNSFFVHPQGSPPDHTEALHVAGTGQGYRFVNTRFVQRGPMNRTQTGALFFHGGDSTFTSCWFDYQGRVAAAHYTLYVYGRGPGAGRNVVRDSAIQKGKAWYVYPVANEGLTPARYVGNRGFFSGRRILVNRIRNR